MKLFLIWLMMFITLICYKAVSENIKLNHEILSIYQTNIVKDTLIIDFLIVNISPVNLYLYNGIWVVDKAELNVGYYWDFNERSLVNSVNIFSNDLNGKSICGGTGIRDFPEFDYIPQMIIINEGDTINFQIKYFCKSFNLKPQSYTANIEFFYIHEYDYNWLQELLGLNLSKAVHTDRNISFDFLELEEFLCASSLKKLNLSNIKIDLKYSYAIKLLFKSNKTIINIPIN